jgi:hypothetical protein
VRAGLDGNPGSGGERNALQLEDKASKYHSYLGLTTWSFIIVSCSVHLIPTARCKFACSTHLCLPINSLLNLYPDWRHLSHPLAIQQVRHSSDLIHTTGGSKMEIELNPLFRN